MLKHNQQKLINQTLQWSQMFETPINKTTALLKQTSEQQEVTLNPIDFDSYFDYDREYLKLDNVSI